MPPVPPPIHCTRGLAQFIHKIQPLPMRLLTTPLALFSLTLLALNDHYLKAAYPGALTGKLSDVAGVLLLPLFLKAVLHVSSRAALLPTAVFFTWWKSPLSQGVIDAWNTLGTYPIGRVVDYTDLLALFLLPISYLVLQRAATQSPPKPGPRLALARFAVLPLCLFFLIATSVDEPPFFDGTVGDCCFTEPLQLETNGGRIVVPSAFTPDGDGLNDTFFIAATPGVAAVDSFLITALPLRDTAFFAPRITDFSPSSGWDGRINGIIPAASYEYTFYTTNTSGQLEQVWGLVCSLPCPNPTNVEGPDEISQCVFFSEFSDSLTLDSGSRSGEQLNCY